MFMRRKNHMAPARIILIGFALLILLGAALLMALLVAVTVGRFGHELTGRLTYPFFALVRNTSVFGVTERIEALETKIDHYEDKLGTYMVKLSRAKLSQKDGHTLSLLLHSISDFERISDHAVNLLDSAREMNEKKMVFSKAAASELHVFAGAVRDIINRSFDSFLQDDVELALSLIHISEPTRP